MATYVSRQLGRMDRNFIRKNAVITSAQVLALNATPVTVLPAPGAGKYYIIEEFEIIKPAGTAYAGIATGEDLSLKYTDASGAVCGTAEMTGFADSTSTTVTFAKGASVIPVVNAAIVAHMLTGEITTGTSPFYLKIFYRIGTTDPNN